MIECRAREWMNTFWYPDLLYDSGVYAIVQTFWKWGTAWRTSNMISDTSAINDTWTGTTTLQRLENVCLPVV